MENAERDLPGRLKTLGAYLAAGAVTAAFFLALLAAYRPPADARVAAAGVSVSRDGAPFASASLPFLACATDSGGFTPGLYAFELGIEAPAGAFGEGAVLVLPFFAGNSLAARLNGELLGARGDPVRGDSSIWNASIAFPVRAGLVAERNRLEVEIRGVYEAGIFIAPYLVDPARHRLLLFALGFFTDKAVWLLIGAVAAMGFIMLGAGYLSGVRMDGRLFLGFGCLALVLFLVDFTLIERLPVPFLAYKKTTVVARHLAGGLLTAACVKLLKRRYDFFALAFIASQIVSCLLVAFYPGDMPGLKRLYSRTYLTSIPFQGYLLFLAAGSVRAGAERRVLIFGVVVAFVTATRDVLAMMFFPSSPFISHYGTGVLAICATIFIVRDMLVNYRSLVHERRRSAMFQEEATRDGLTGAFNRKILAPLAEGLGPDFAVFFVDLDDFKLVNDRRGHAAGDAVLRQLVETMRFNLRAKDYLVRTGGDEFLAVLPECGLAKASELAERLVAEVAATELFPPAAVLSPGGEQGADAGLRYTISVGVAARLGSDPVGLEGFLAVLARADAAAYSAKRAGKGRVGYPPEAGSAGAAQAAPA